MTFRTYRKLFFSLLSTVKLRKARINIWGLKSWKKWRIIKGNLLPLSRRGRNKLLPPWWTSPIYSFRMKRRNAIIMSGARRKVWRNLNKKLHQSSKTKTVLSKTAQRAIYWGWNWKGLPTNAKNSCKKCNASKKAREVTIKFKT